MRASVHFGLWYGLRRKLIITISVLLILVLATVSYLAMTQVREGIISQMRRDGTALARSYASNAESAILLDNWEEALARMTGVARRGDEGIRYLLITDVGGRILASTNIRQVGTHSHDPLIQEARATQVSATDMGRHPITQEGIGPDGAPTFRVVVPLVTLGSPAGALEVGLDLRNLDQAILQTNLRFIGFTLLAILIGAITAGFFIRTITHPVDQLVLAAREIAAGHYDTRLDIPVGDELGILASSLNEMVRSLLDAQELRRHMHEVEKLAMLGQVAAGVAHEVRNPLGPIKICAQSILGKTTDEDPHHRQALTIVREVDRLNQVVDRFLNYARPTHAELQLTNLDETLEHVVGLACLRAEAQQCRVMVTKQPLPLLRFNPDRMEQAFLNVVLNALSALQCGGCLCIDTTVEWQKRTVQVAFRDDGSGIPTDELDRVFEPFYTTRQGGTGLGLAIVQQIMQEHEGEVLVRSTVGRGTTVLIRLPIPMEIPNEDSQMPGS